MLFNYKNKRQNSPLPPEIKPSDVSGNELLGIDVFFIIRAAGWMGIGILIVLFTVLLGKVSGMDDTGFLIASSLMILGIMGLYAGRLLYIGKSHKYFILTLTCHEIYYPKLHEAPGDYFNPNSPAAFRSGQKVTFKMSDDRSLIFTFDRGRKFMEGSQYAFYFTSPSSNEPVTFDMLERLKIDHTIIPQNIASEDTK